MRKRPTKQERDKMLRAVYHDEKQKMSQRFKKMIINRLEAAYYIAYPIIAKMEYITEPDGTEWVYVFDSKAEILTHINVTGDDAMSLIIDVTHSIHSDIARGGGKR